METAATPAPKTKPAASPFPPNFGAFIFRRRKELGLMQEQVAEAVRDTRTSIANLERAGRAPYTDAVRLAELAAVLQVGEAEVVDLAEVCRARYVLPGVGVTQLHRDLAVELEAGWPSFSDDVLTQAVAVVERAPAERVTATPSAFGAWLLDARLRHAPQIGQPEVAKVAGIVRSYVSMVENGEKGVSWPVEKIDAVAVLLNADVEHVRALAARSRQFYALVSVLPDGSVASLAHRRLAAVLERRWSELGAKALTKVLAALRQS